ncbi:MAG TPA: glycosyltransferase family 39 protein [Anaerolineae bacterium]|nr:glycosyltransferase family 39 protein [Anaerolineae bacterium]
MSASRTVPVDKFRRAIYAGFALALLVATVIFLRQAQWVAESIVPIVRLWPDADAQYRAQLHGIPYDLLRAADAVLPRAATVLLVTPGRDVRHQEYTAFHRALYFLTPRPIWWLSPAPPDGAWESRWWVSAPATAESVQALAVEKGASYVLAYGLAQPLSIGQKVLERDDGFLLKLDNAGSATIPAARLEYAGTLWPVQLALAVGVMGLLGHAALALIGRAGYRSKGVEAVSMAWLLGAGLTSIGMFWLNVLGVSLQGQRLGLTLLALGGVALRGYLKKLRRQTSEVYHQSIPRFQFRQGKDLGGLSLVRPSRRSALVLLLVLLLIVHIAYVAVLASGRPLDIWDSWVTWGMKARTIFLNDGISPAVYAEPSRAVTHLDYPLLMPMLEAWIYAWLGAPDDRFAGVVSIWFYLALLGLCYSAARRRGASALFALVVTTTMATMASLALGAGLVFADVPLAAFATLAAVYLIRWLKDRSWGTLIIAAIAAGLMVWTKREGVVLLAALCLSILLVGRDIRRTWVGIGALLFAALLFVGPWWLLLVLNGVANTDFAPITWTTFQANLGRLPTIAWMMFGSLISVNWNYVWPICGLIGGSLLIGRLKRENTQPALDSTANLYLLIAACYLGLMSLSYIFSAYAPYQQHVASSVDRLVAHVAPLPVLWLAHQSVGKR